LVFEEVHECFKYDKKTFMFVGESKYSNLTIGKTTEDAAKYTSTSCITWGEGDIYTDIQSSSAGYAMLWQTEKDTKSNKCEHVVLFFEHAITAQG